MNRLLAIVLVAACGGGDRDPIDPGPIIEPRVPQTTQEQRVDGDKPGYLGVLVPRGLAEITAPFTSTVTKLDVKLGDSVTRGQRLALLDDRPLREELDIANALLRASRAASAQADVERRAAIATYEREQRAYQQGVASQAEVTTAEFNQRKAEMNLARAQANVEEQRARIAQLSARLADTSLVAPIDGRVALLYLRAGDRVEEGRSVIRVISSDELFVKFAIPAEKAGTLTGGAQVEIHIDRPALKLQGVVRHVAPEIDPVAGLIIAEADMTSPPPTLQSGTECRVVPGS